VTPLAFCCTVARVLPGRGKIVMHWPVHSYKRVGDHCLSAGPALAMRAPVGNTFAGPHSVGCAEIFDGRNRAIIIEISDVKEQGLMGRYQARVIWRHAPSFTSPAETSTDISVPPNKSMSYCIQYLLSSHGTSRGVGYTAVNWPCIERNQLHCLMWSASKDITN